MATSDPYAPGTVPRQTSKELHRFLSNEFYKLSLLLNELLAARQYASLIQRGGQALALTAVRQIMPFTSSSVSEGIEANVATNDMTVTADGDYLLLFTANSAATQNVVITFEPYINGAPSGIVALSEIIQQATAQLFSSQTMTTLKAGDVVSMYVSGAPNRTVTFDNVNFLIARL